MEPTQPTSQTNVLKALLSARREFAPVVKRKDNQHLRTRYADLSAFLDAVTPALLKHGLVLLHRTECDGGAITLVTELCHAESGERLTSRYPVHSRKLDDPKANDLQLYGSAMQYARRYCGMALLGVAAEDDDDDDGQQASRPPQKATGPAGRPRQAPPAPPTEAELEATANEIAGCEKLADLTRLYEASPVLVRERLKPAFSHRKAAIQAAQADRKAKKEVDRETA